MSKHAIRTVVILLLATLAAGPAVAEGKEGWPQWRGPDRDGKAPDTNLMGSWPEGGPPLVWKADGLGSGFSSVSVLGQRVYTMGDLEDGQYVIAVSRGDGERLWATKVGPRWDDRYLGPRSTPTVRGNRVWALSTEGDLVCLDAKSGKVQWKRSLPGDFGGSMMKAQGTYQWKFSESPLIDGNRVVVTPGARDAAMVALDARTGETVWKTAIPDLGERGADGAGYSSIVVSEGGGRKQYVQLIGRGAIGVDAGDGEFLWGYNRVANDVANIPTPLVDGDHVFVSTGYGTGAALLRLKPKEGGVTADEVYFLAADTMQNHHGGMILHEGHVYTGTAHNKGFPLAVELKSGKVAWGPVRNEGQGSAAVAFADGRLYFRYQNGLMVLIEATPEAYRERGSFMIPDVKRESWPHPAIADGQLYLREQEMLYVYDLRGGTKDTP